MVWRRPQKSSELDLIAPHGERRTNFGREVGKEKAALWGRPFSANEVGNIFSKRNFLGCDRFPDFGRAESGDGVSIE